MNKELYRGDVLLLNQVNPPRAWRSQCIASTLLKEFLEARPGDVLYISLEMHKVADHKPLK